jgi:hypothetical protein
MTAGKTVAELMKSKDERPFAYAAIERPTLGASP